MQKVAVNEFVKRQVRGSGKTYSPDLSFEEIARHAEEQMKSGHFREGYREGARIVDASEEFSRHFICPFIKIKKNTELTAKWVKRRPEEQYYVRIRALGDTPEKTGKVEFILYSRETLQENEEQSGDSDWELISIQALPEGVKKLPMGPITMMRNQLELPGGTKGLYTSEQWAASVWFWQNYAALDN